MTTKEAAELVGVWPQQFEELASGYGLEPSRFDGWTRKQVEIVRVLLARDSAERPRLEVLK